MFPFAQARCQALDGGVVADSGAPPLQTVEAAEAWPSRLRADDVKLVSSETELRGHAPPVVDDVRVLNDLRVGLTQVRFCERNATMPLICYAH